MKASIALGSNLGDSRALVLKGIETLRKLSRTPPRGSSLWRSTPVDCPPGSADFINAVAEIEPLVETPEELLKALQTIEREFGRTPKTILNEARPLDLDLLAWGSEVRTSPELTLPHPRAHLRAFVLAPLAEIAPDLILPGQGKSVRELLQNLRTGEKLERLS